MADEGASPTGYRALADLLRDRIHAGVLAPGQQLPSEVTLAQTYGLALTTVRRATDLLRDEGLIDKRHGYPARVRIAPDLEDVPLRPGDAVTYRMPSATERDEQGIPPGVPFLVRVGPDGTRTGYRGDRYRPVVPPQ